MRSPSRRRAAAAQSAPEPQSQGPSFVLSCVDLPRNGERLQPGGMLAGKGWAISESPIASIAVHLGDLFLCYASYGQPRPEIGRDFGHYPQAHHSGFIFSVRIGPEIEQSRGTDLEFRFRTENGSESRRHVRLAWAAETSRDPQDDAATRPWPIRLALEECRIDGAGRLRLRGWAIARAEFSSLDLFLNETRLHAPERGLERTDIAQRHPAYPGAALSGFRLVQALDRPLDDSDCVRVVARAGDIQRQIIVPLALPDAQRSLLQAGAVSLCCETLRLSRDGVLAIAGWAVGAADTREIEVLTDAGPLGLAEIGLPRPDIGNRFPQLPGARFAGFRFRHHAPDAAGAPLTLVVRDSDGDERQLRLRVPGPAAADATDGTEIIHAGIDSPALRDGRATVPIRGVVSIAGWAVCASGVAAVEIWSDDTRLSDAYIGVRREDIAATYPDLSEALTSGFALTVPHRLIGDGEHAIRVVIRARSGATTEDVFRVVLESDDDSRIGAIRRVVPYTETALRLELLARFGPLPAFTVLIRRAGANEPRGLAATLDSLRRQSLASWRAIVLVHDEPERAAAQALIAAEPALAGRVLTQLATDDIRLWTEPPAGRFELLCIMRAADRFGADALIELALEARLSGAEFVYADERCFDPARDSVHPFLKPGWSPDLLLSTNYIGRAWCATRTLADRCGIKPRLLDRFGEYDLVLRLTDAANAVVHLPLSLAERIGRRIEPKPREQEALQRAARRQQAAADILPGLAPGAWRLKRALHTDALVSVIIATCGARDLVRTAITSLRANTTYAPIEIVVLDDVPADQPALKLWLRHHADRVVPVGGPFNWSRANNFGARAAAGDFLLFLNDDTEFRDPDWLAALLEHAQRPEVGAVGAQLLYPDGKVQHAGMFLRGADGLHAFRFAAADEPGSFGLALTQRDVTAVTGACMLVRRAVFEALGGFDEHHGVIKNDLDFCLRVNQAGLRVIYTPHASLTHHEMASRAPLADSFDAPRFDGAWAIRQLQGDPLINPNLARDCEDYLAEIEPVQWLQPGSPLIARDQVRRILVVKLDHIGDFICALPAIERLRTTFPHAHITLLGASSSIALAKLSTAIDEVVQFDFFAARSIAGKRAISEAELDVLAAVLRPLHFDIAVDLRMHADTRHVLRYTGAALFAGFDHGGRFPWLDIVLEWEGDLRLLDKRTHVTDALLRLAGAIADAARPPDPPRTVPADSATIDRLLAEAGAPPGFSGRKLVCIHPGAGTPLKQWPVASFAGLIRLLLHAHDLSVVLIGSGDEAGVAADVAALVGRPDVVLSLAGAVKLTELPSLLAACVLFVGNDSGPKHMAGALGVPTVGVHASHVDAAEWGPPGPRAIAIRRHMSCGPCYISEESDCPRGVTCLRAITPAQVYRACRLLLGFAFPVGDNVSAASIASPSRRSARRGKASGVSTPEPADAG